MADALLSNTWKTRVGNRGTEYRLKEWRDITYSFLIIQDYYLVVLSANLGIAGWAAGSETILDFSGMPQAERVGEIRGAWQGGVPALVGFDRDVNREAGRRSMWSDLRLRERQKSANVDTGTKIGIPQKARMRRPCGKQKQSKKENTIFDRSIEKMERREHSKGCGGGRDGGFAETDRGRLEKPEQDSGKRWQEKPEPSREGVSLGLENGNERAGQHKEKWNEKTFSFPDEFAKPRAQPAKCAGVPQRNLRNAREGAGKVGLHFRDGGRHFPVHGNSESGAREERIAGEDESATDPGKNDGGGKKHRREREAFLLRRWTETQSKEGNEPAGESEDETGEFESDGERKQKHGDEERELGRSEERFLAALGMTGERRGRGGEGAEKKK